MSFTALAHTHAIGREKGLTPFFFSRFVFDEMRKLGNTHFCFRCGGPWGFRLDRKGQPTNCEGDGWNPMRRHDPKTHRHAVVGGANKFEFASDWLKAMLARKKDFPFIVNIT